MARSTRSKKVEITEDRTSTLEAQTAPPADSQTPHLAEGAGNTMPGEEVSVKDQLKDLKQAYREAIGMPKKSNKGKNKKGNGTSRANGQENTEELNRSNVSYDSPKVVGAAEHNLSNDLDISIKVTGPAEHTRSDRSDISNKVAGIVKPTRSVELNNSDQPVRRTTRGQAKAQEGPYEDFLADKLRRRNDSSDAGRARDNDFLMSLIAGRSAANSRSLNSISRSLKGQAANTLEALRKAIADTQFPVDDSFKVSEHSGAVEIPNANPNCSDAIEHTNIETILNASPSHSVAEPVRDRQHGDEDSFVEQITSRSPAKPFTGPRDSVEMRSVRPSQSPTKPERLGAQLLRDRDSAMDPNCSNPVTTSAKDQASKQTADEDEDSFVGHISSRSPAKQASRIEDSVEALDQMEEVEEALHEAAMAENLVSPEKKREKKEQPRKQTSGAQLREFPSTSKTDSGNHDPKPAVAQSLPNLSTSKIKSGNHGTKAASAPKTSQSLRVKSAPKRASVIKKTTSMIFKPSESSDTSDQAKKPAPFKQPTCLLPPKERVKSTKPPTRPTNFELPGEAIARKLKEQRELRLAQRESSQDSSHTASTFSGPTVKSTKPLTKPIFELPGEALSRKKREAHEAKVKAQEEEERKRREFKARPVRKSVLLDTAASRARQSRIGLENVEDGKSSVSKRISMDVSAHRPSIVELANMVANTSAPRAPGPPAAIERKPSTKFNGPSMSGLAMQRTVSAAEVQQQRQRAKEIYNRDQKLAEDIERERREREAAAKRSREEAAERGRQASREWAEKQRAKKLAEGDKGMSAGYGPGGQMGLGA